MKIEKNSNFLPNSNFCCDAGHTLIEVKFQVPSFVCKSTNYFRRVERFLLRTHRLVFV